MGSQQNRNKVASLQLLQVLWAENVQGWIDPLGLWGTLLARVIPVVVGAISKLASKLKCGKCAAAIPRTVSFGGNQLHKKFKHASDFGISGNY